MKNKIYSFVFILITTISFSSYANADFEITPDIETLVPENTLIYFQITNTLEMMSNIDDFLSKTEIDEMIGKVSVYSLLSLLLESTDSGISLDYFNLSHPMGLAILPSSDKFAKKDDIEFMVFLPINSPVDIMELISKKTVNDNTWYTLFMNYLVYFSSESLKNNFPSDNIAILSNLDRYSSDSLSIYFDPPGLMETFGVDPSEIIKKLEYQNSGGSNFPAGIIQGYFNIFHQIDSSFSNIRLDRKGILLQNDMFFSGNMEKLLQSFSKTENIKKWSAYLPENGYFQSIYSMDSKNYTMIINLIVDNMFSEFGNDPVMLEMKQNMELFLKYTGGGGAFSFDIVPASNKTENNLDLFPYNISLNMVTELSDSDGFLEEFRNFYSSQSMNEIMNSIYTDSGFTVQITMEEQSMNDISPVFKIKYNFEEKRTKSGNNHKEMGTGMNFLNNIELWYHISEGKLFFYMGSDGIEGLKKLSLPHEIEKEWIDSVPVTSNFIWEISLAKILNQINSFPGTQDRLPVSDIPLNISGYSSIENGSIYSNMNISSEDIRNMFKVFTSK